MKMFSSGRIGELELKNRVIVAPNGIRGEADADGTLSDRAIARYTAYARGGAGLITVGHLHVENKVEDHLNGVWSNKPRIDGEVYKLKWEMLTNAVHDYGAKVSANLSAGFGRMAYPDTVNTNPVLAPSEVPCYWNPAITARAMTKEEIRSIVQAMGTAAARLRSVGVDAVELHACAGHLIDQFLSEPWNHRTDEYGGSTENRLRFLLEILSDIKNKAGADFPVIVRMSLKNYVPGGRDLEESLEMVRILEKSGVDAIHATAGTYEYRRFANPSTYRPVGEPARFAEMIKPEVSIPVIAFGKLYDPAVGERLLQEGKADFIALARPWLADQDWAEKARTGRWEDIRPCIGCHEGCLVRSLENKYVSCALNPTSGMERELTLEQARDVKKILVIGGGPGGMEVSRVAALRGHTVTLVEKSGELGGSFLAAAKPDFKADLRNFIDYEKRQVAKLPVRVRLNTEATAELVEKMAPDAVVMATGAVPVVPQKLPGVENACTAVEVLNGQKECAGSSAVVIGGGTVGCETAAWLAESMEDVTVVEMRPELLADLNVFNRKQLIELMEERRIKTMTDTTVTEIKKDGVVVRTASGEEKTLKADNVLLAVGMRPADELRCELAGKDVQLYSIGSCVRPGIVMGAIWDAYRLGRML